MSVKLIYSTPLYLISNAIRYSHNNHHLSDTEEAREDYIKNNLDDNNCFVPYALSYVSCKGLDND
jgi:K+-transporting ATPase c subunit